MAYSRLLHLNPRRIRVVERLCPNSPLLYGSFSTISSDPPPPPPPPQTPKPTSLSARMSFIFDQIDQIESNQRSANEEKDETLQRIRAWRQSKNQKPITPVAPIPSESDSLENLKSELEKSTEGDFRVSGAVELDKEVELVHPWAEWVEFMERLVHQNYFDYRRKDEDGMMERLGLEIREEGSDGGVGKNLMRDFKAVQNAVLNFGRDRFDILRSLSRQDLQLLVGYGCPSSMDKRAVFSAKLLRKHVHLDEGDVCSSCSLRNSCEKAYLLTNKEDEARTIDVMRILLTYGFDPIYGSVENKSLLKMKSVKTVIRKLLHEVVKLSAVPIDPNLSPPVIKKPPPKVKQPPPPPRKRIGRNDIEMKKGDWLCPKCDFMNFAKNNVCLHCDAKRPKRQLLPGEWECPQCNFLNYRRNTVCFHCEHNRPPETYAENQFAEKQHSPGFRTSKIPDRAEISNAWNFDFDDDESDGADVAAFENADSIKLDKDYSLDKRSYENSRRLQNSMENRGGSHQRMTEHSRSPGEGFNDFDEEDEDDVDNYELVNPNEEPKISRVDFSELESDLESDDTETNTNPKGRTRLSAQGKKQQQQRRAPSCAPSEDEIEFNSDDDLPIHPKYKSTHVAASFNRKQTRSRDVGISYSDEDDDDIGLSSDLEDEAPRSTKRENHRLGSNGANRSKDRPRSNFKAGPFSEDDRSYSNGYRQRDRAAGQRRPIRDESRNWGSKKPSLTDRRYSGSQRNSRDDYFEDSSHRGKRKNGKGIGKFSKSSQQSDRKHASFDKRGGGRSSSFDGGSNNNSNYLDDERHRRPRNNVR